MGEGILYEWCRLWHCTFVEDDFKIMFWQRLLWSFVYQFVQRRRWNAKSMRSSNSRAPNSREMAVRSLITLVECTYSSFYLLPDRGSESMNGHVVHQTLTPQRSPSPWSYLADYRFASNLAFMPTMHLTISQFPSCPTQSHTTMPVLPSPTGFSSRPSDTLCFVHR